MATEMLMTTNITGETHSTIQSSENDTDSTDYTVAATKVFDHGGKTGTLLAPGDTVTGKTSAATATVVFASDPTSHSSISQGQILLKSISGTFQSGEQVYKTIDVDFVVLSDAGDSAIAKLDIRKNDGVIDENPSIGGGTGNITNHRLFTVPVADRSTLGNENSGTTIKSTAGSNCMDLNEDFAIVEWIEFDASAGVTGRCISAGSTTPDQKVRNVICHDAPGHGISFHKGKLFNSYTYNNGDRGFSSSSNVVLNGVTSFGNTNNGLHGPTGKIISQNDLSFGNGGDDYVNTGFEATTRNNMSGDGTAPSSSKTSGTATSGTTTTKVFATGETFQTDGRVAGQWLNNTTRALSAKIQSVDSETELTLETAIAAQVSGDAFVAQDSARFKTDTDVFVSVTGGSEDFHLKVGSIAEDEGVDLGTTDGVNIDIDGSDRDALGVTWDMGGHELLAAAAGPENRHKPKGLTRALTRGLS